MLGAMLFHQTQPGLVDELEQPVADDVRIGRWA